MRHILKIFFTILGCVLILNAMVLARITNFNSGCIITLFIGLILGFYGLYFNKVNIITKTGILKWAKYILFAFFAFLVCLIAFTAIYGHFDNTTYKEDAVVVLGAGIRGEKVTLPLAHRLDKAIEYANKNPNAVIVVSGGKGLQEDVTEAYAMEQYLISKGMLKQKILKEEKSTSTFENMLFSKEILDNYFEKSYQTVIITNNFHIYRATQIAKNAKLNATHLHAKLDWYTVPLNYLRECFGVMKLWILSK
jgi:uncharacterized SAM-binding protein YcdF (DUF218 family)